MSKEKWIFTDWGFGMSNFKIYDSYESFNLITSRDINKDGCIQWFNIDNVKRETILQANKQNTNRDKSNPFSKEIRIIE